MVKSVSTVEEPIIQHLWDQKGVGGEGARQGMVCYDKVDVLLLQGVL